MFSSTMKSLLSTILLASVLAPWGVLGTVMPQSVDLDKREVNAKGSECWGEFAKNPDKCPVLQVAFFKDRDCSQPLTLAINSAQGFIQDNKQMLFDGAVSTSLKSPLVKEPVGSVRIVGAVKGLGLGFAREAESDGAVQNMAWLSSAETFKAFEKKACLNLLNLDAKHVGVWSTKFDDSFNQAGYVWNRDNIPITESARACGNGKHTLGKKAQGVCLDQASWGGGGVLNLYDSDDCTGPAKKQYYTTAQCTQLKVTNFKSFKAVDPAGDTIPVNFSPVFHDVGQDGYHRCAQRDITTKPYKWRACQKLDAGDMFVGVYGNDPQFPQPPPAKDDAVICKSPGQRLLSPGKAKGSHRKPGPGFYGP